MRKGTIYDYHIELQSWKRQGTILEIFFGAHILAFYQEYGDVIQSIEAEIMSLRHKLYVHDPDGKVCVENNEPVLLSGITRDEANKQFTALLEQPLPMKLHKAHGLKKIVS